MATTTLPSSLVNEKIASEILGVTMGTLQVWRCTRRRPDLKFVRVGRAIRYRVEDIEKFIESRTVGAAE